MITKTKRKINRGWFKKGHRRGMTGRKQSEEHKRKIHEAQIKGRKPHQGYVLIYKPNHPHAYRLYVFEHRYVMEQHIRRYLDPTERVHHLNGIKEDNRIENLKLFVNEAEHQKLHMPKGRKIGS